MDEDKVVITYETIFELLRREKDREALQKLEKTFFQDILEYLKEKKKVLLSPALASQEERKRNEKQFQNIKKLVTEFYDRREKKIVGMALDKSRTEGSLIDTSSLLEEEKKLFESLVKLLNDNRADVLYRTLDQETAKQDNIKEIEKKPDVKKEEKKSTDAEEKSRLMVRFVHAVPKFIGKELEEYGPFEEEEIANLPREIAMVLIEKGRAEEIKES